MTLKIYLKKHDAW